MGQIVSSAAKPKRCNLQSLSSLGTPAAGEHILVSSDNSMNEAGHGNFDCYIEGDGRTAATALVLKPIASKTATEGDMNSITSDAVSSALEDIGFQLSENENFVVTPKTIAKIKVTEPLTVDASSTLYYFRVRNGQKFTFIPTFSSNYVRHGFVSEFPREGLSVTSLAANGTGVSGTEISKTSPFDGYFCISFLTSAFTSLSIVAENPHKGIGIELASFEEEVDNRMSKIAETSLEVSSVSNVRVAEPFSSTSGEILKYFPVKKGWIYKFYPVFTSGYIRRAFCNSVPAVGVAAIEYTSNGTGVSGTEMTVTSPINGYFACSFAPSALTSFSAKEVNPQQGLGIDVAALENQMKIANGTQLAITGRANAEYATTGTLAIESGKKYRVYILDWSSQEERAEYIKLKLEIINSSTSASRTLCDYKGNDCFPEYFYFETAAGEDTFSVYTRITPNHVVTFVVQEISEIDVFNFNDYNDNLIRLSDMRKVVVSGGTSPFTLLHFSDIHGDAANMSRITGYRQKLRPLIDDIIHTGDMVASKVNATSFDFWDEVPNSAEILNVIGNHDIWYTDGFSHDANYPYVTYFKPYIDNEDWGTIVQPDNAEANNLCYYYKDYAAKNIRLIVLDYNEYATADVTWFENALAGAKTNGYHVIVAIHYMPTLKEEFNTGFNIGTDYYSPLSGGIAAGFANAVESFITNGGHFVCWLCGHEHRDYCGVAGTNTRQVVLSIDCAALRNDSTTRYRAVDTRSQDAFNLLSVNTNANTIQVFRVGNDRDAMLRHIGVMCIDYANGTLLYTE